MKFKEIWNYCLEGKLFIIWLLVLCIYIVFNLFISDVVSKILLIFAGYTVILVPLLWFLGIFLIKKQKGDLKSAYNWKHGLWFEYVFFLFLFVSQYFLAFFIYYLSKNEFWQIFFTGILILAFGISAIFAGLCHYIYKFDM